MAALDAQPKVHPPITGGQALLAAAGCVGRRRLEVGGDVNASLLGHSRVLYTPPSGEPSGKLTEPLGTMKWVALVVLVVPSMALLYYLDQQSVLESPES